MMKLPPLAGNLSKPSGRPELKLDPEAHSLGVMAEFAELQPRVVVELLTDARLYSLARREADLVFRIQPFDEPDVVARKLTHIRYSAYLKKGMAASDLPILQDAAVNWDGQPVAVVIAETLEQAPTVGKTGTILEDIPQSISVISHELSDLQGDLELRDTVRNASGVIQGGTDGFGFADRFQIRGLEARIYNDGFSDGDERNGIPHSLNGVERVEVLEGPGSSLFGSGPPGGTINLVHYTPSPGTGAGAFQKAITQSPIYLSGVPPCLITTSATVERYRFTVSRVSRADSSKNFSARS